MYKQNYGIYVKYGICEGKLCFKPECETYLKALLNSQMFMHACFQKKIDR